MTLTGMKRKASYFEDAIADESTFKAAIAPLVKALHITKEAEREWRICTDQNCELE